MASRGILARFRVLEGARECFWMATCTHIPILAGGLGIPPRVLAAGVAATGTQFSNPWRRPASGADIIFEQSGKSANRAGAPPFLSSCYLLTLYESEKILTIQCRIMRFFNIFITY